jgi:hypothetical protein
MNEEMMKSLVALIDESLAEIEELKKSDRFSASEVKLEGPGAGIAGKEPNGNIGKKEDKDEDEDKKDKDGKDMDKGEGANRQADPNGGHHKAPTGSGEAVKSEGSPMYAGAADGSNHGYAEGVNRQADPNGGHHKAAHMGKAEDKDDKKKKDEDEKDVEEKMKKSAEEAATLMKSYVDQRLTPIESKLEALMGLVKQVADAPVPARGVSYRNVTPLKKSDESVEELSKSAVVEKLFELKKTGHRVDSVDIASAELANAADLAKIVQKYNIK